MQPTELARLGGGDLSATRHNSPCNEQPPSPAVPRGYAGARRSAESGVSTAPQKAAVFARNLLIILGFLTWRRMISVAEAAQPPTSSGRQSPALTLALDTKARQTQFQFSPYAEKKGSRLIFSEAALRSLAQRLFPSSKDELKRRKLLEVGSRIDLSKEILDLTPSQKVTQLKTKLEQPTKKFGRSEQKLRNPMEFSNAVRLAFHSFVNKQEVKAMAALHLENPELAKQLENVNVTPELRHLVASALPAIQPANPTPEEKAALNKISSFYTDLTSTRQRLVETAMKKVDLSPPVDFGNIFKEGATSVPTPAQVELFMKTAQDEAEKRAADAYRQMAPSEKLDFASAGLTVAHLSETVLQKLLEKVESTASENTSISHATKTAKTIVAARTTPEKNSPGKRRAILTGVTLGLLFGMVAAAAAYATKRKLRFTKSQRRERKEELESEGKQLHLNVEELATMPLSALRSKARSKRRKRGIRRAFSDEGKYQDQPKSQDEEHINGDSEATKEAALVSRKSRHL